MAGDSSATRGVLLCTADEVVLGGAGALAAVGFSPIRCSSLKEFLREFGDLVVAVVLDAELPKRETCAIYRELRKEGKTPRTRPDRPVSLSTGG